jgi:uncharacterized RDD family membrane protein YckC
MKCPKCGYLGFEAVDRCRNCGYDFSLTTPPAPQELPIRGSATAVHPIDDLSLIDAAAPIGPPPVPSSSFASDLEQILTVPRARDAESELPLFLDEEDDAPLISAARPPRPPLAVRRGTPEAPRVRTPQPRTPMLDLAPEPQTTFNASVTPGARGRADAWIAPLPHDGPQPAALGSRLLAVVVDVLILAIIDAAVVYFTMQICGLDLSDIAILPRGPLAAFLVVQNGGYLVVFTAGGQTLGKMLAGIRVVPARSNMTLDLGQAVVRTIVWTVLAVPAGLGFLSALGSSDRRGLHDRVAGTKVVRASA